MWILILLVFTKGEVGSTGGLPPQLKLQQPVFNKAVTEDASPMHVVQETRLSHIPPHATIVSRILAAFCIQD
jgi:hypothetical protein